MAIPKLMELMADAVVRPAFADKEVELVRQQTVAQIEGFGSYGFPESHAASFALIAYASSWLKGHHPDVFCCALLNAQSMGFYAPPQIVRDAREHGVGVREVDVNHSDWDCTLEEGHLRLGLRQVDGLHRESAARLVLRRPYHSVEDLRALYRRWERGNPSPDVDQTWENWLCFPRNGGAAVGSMPATILADRTALVAYAIYVPYQRRGYAREAAAAVLAHVRDEHNVKRAIAEMDPRNEASIGLARALGFTCARDGERGSDSSYELSLS